MKFSLKIDSPYFVLFEVEIDFYWPKQVEKPHPVTLLALPSVDKIFNLGFDCHSCKFN